MKEPKRSCLALRGYKDACLRSPVDDEQSVPWRAFLAVPEYPTTIKAQGNDLGSLFPKHSLWQHGLIEMKQNGGVVVLFEKEADVRLVDHTRKNLPPDTYESRDQWIACKLLTM